MMMCYIELSVLSLGKLAGCQFIRGESFCGLYWDSCSVVGSADGNSFRELAGVNKLPATSSLWRKGNRKKNAKGYEG